MKSIELKKIEKGNRSSQRKRIEVNVATDEKCRCCFRKFYSLEKKIQCLDSQKTRFEELTGMPLHLYSGMPTKICELCELDLLFFSKIKKDFVEKQNYFYKELQEKGMLKNFKTKKEKKKEEDRVQFNHHTLQIALPEQVEIKEEKVDHGILVIIKQEEIYEELNDRNEKQDLLKDENEPPLHFPPTWDDEDEDFPLNPMLLHDYQLPRQEEEEPSTYSFKNESQRTKCPHCSRLVLNLRPHRLKAHKLKWVYKCDYCPYSHYLHHFFLRHMEDIHSEAGQLIPKTFFKSRRGRSAYAVRKKFCSECGKFVTSLNHHKHASNIVKEKNNQCDLCGFCTASKYHLVDHFKRKHSELHKFDCKICMKKFKFEKDLQLHVENIHRSRDHVCIACGKAYGSMLLLKKHNKVKHGEQKNVCDFCSKPFQSASSLRFHRNVHLNNAEYTCKNCPKAFYNPRGLYRHFCVDSTDVPCGALGCESKFRRDDLHVKHLKNHYGVDEETKKSLIRQARTAHETQRNARKAMYQ